jgi:anti-sigma factor RsiW
MADPDADHTAYEEDFSDHIEKRLSPARTKELDAHLAGCERCREEYARFRETMGALSGLRRMPAPQKFEEQVTQTINKRSAGMFFGRKAFGDRIPFELLAVVGLALLIGLYVLLRWSTTGPVHEPLQKAPKTDTVPDDVRRVIPTP